MKDNFHDIASLLVAVIAGAVSAITWVTSNFASFRELESLENRLIRIEEKIDAISTLKR